MPTISLTMIVKDEAANLPACLASCANLFDELIIVDTGSTDSTKAIAAAARDKHGRQARVFDFEWCDDFAAARNESLRHATGDWVFWMDADDRLDADNGAKLCDLFSSLSSNQFYQMTTRSTWPLGKESRARDVAQYRLLPLEGVFWRGAIHELPIHRGRIFCQPTDIVIEHVGYEDDAILTSKVDRNIRITKQSLERSPRDVQLLELLVDLNAGVERYREMADACQFLLNAITRTSDPQRWELTVHKLAWAAANIGRADAVEWAIEELESCGRRSAAERAAALRPLVRQLAQNAASS